MPANFHESQFVDAGDGQFGIKLSLPAPAAFTDLGMVNLNGWRLPVYDIGPVAPDGDYWLLVKPDGTAWVWPVAEHDVKSLGSFGHFRKQNGVAFVVPWNVPAGQEKSSFGYVFCAK